MEVEKLFRKVDFPDWESFLEKSIPAGSVLAFEASGNAFEFAELCKRHGHRPVVMDSASAKRIAKAYCKTDPKDARQIAKVYLSGLEEEVWTPDCQTRVLREVVSAFESASKSRTRANNKIKMFLNGRMSRLGKEHGNLGKASSRKWILQAWQWSPEEREILSVMFSDYDHAAKQKKALCQLMAQEVFSNPSMAKLMRICGIRVVTAYSLMAAIGDINRFENPKKLVAYLGLAPSVTQSGAKCHSGGLQHGGRRSSRTLLVEAGQSILNSKRDSAASIKRWGLKLYFKKSSKCFAAAAIARKLAVAVWYALKGFLPEIISQVETLHGKLLGIARELGLAYAKKLGFKTCVELADEYAGAVLLYAGGSGG